MLRLTTMDKERFLMLRKNSASLTYGMLHTRTIIMSTHANPFEVKSMEEQIGDNGEILSVNTLGKKCFNAPKIFHLS